MFDIGFSELVVIGLVALIVIGPERLPKVARAAGLLLGRLQRYVSDVKADINREMQLDELKKVKDQFADHARSMGASFTEEMHAVHESLNQTIAPIGAELQAQSPAAGEAGDAPPKAEPGSDRTAEKPKA